MQTCVKIKNPGCAFGNVVITAIVRNHHNTARGTPWFKVMCGNREAAMGIYNTFFLPNNEPNPSYGRADEAWGTVTCCDLNNGERITVVSTSDKGKKATSNRMLVSARRRNPDGSTGANYAFHTSEAGEWSCANTPPAAADAAAAALVEIPATAFTPARSSSAPYRAFSTKYNPLRFTSIMQGQALDGLKISPGCAPDMSASAQLDARDGKLRSDVSKPVGDCPEIAPRANWIWMQDDQTGSVTCQSPPVYLPTAGWRIKNLDTINWRPKLQTLRLLQADCLSAALRPGNYTVIASTNKINSNGLVVPEHSMYNAFKGFAYGPTTPIRDIDINTINLFQTHQSSNILAGDYWIGAQTWNEPSEAVACIRGFMGGVGTSDNYVPERMVVEQLNKDGNSWSAVREFPETTKCCGTTLKAPHLCPGKREQALDFKFKWVEPRIAHGFRIVALDHTKYRPGINELIFSSAPCGEAPVSVLPPAGEYEAVSSGMRCSETRAACGPELAFTNTNDPTNLGALDGWFTPDEKYKTPTGEGNEMFIGGVTGLAPGANNDVKCVLFKQRKTYSRYEMSMRIRVDRLIGDNWSPMWTGLVRGSNNPPSAQTNTFTNAAANRASYKMVEATANLTVATTTTTTPPPSQSAFNTEFSGEGCTPDHNVVATAVVYNRYNKEDGAEDSKPNFELFCGGRPVGATASSAFTLTRPGATWTRTWGITACCTLNAGERVSVSTFSPQNKAYSSNKMLVSVRARDATTGSTGGNFAFAVSEIGSWQCRQEANYNDATGSAGDYSPSVGWGTPGRAFSPSSMNPLTNVPWMTGKGVGQNCTMAAQADPLNPRSDTSIAKDATCKEVDPRAAWMWLKNDQSGNVQCESQPLRVPVTGWRIINTGDIRYRPKLNTLRLLKADCETPALMASAGDATFVPISSGQYPNGNGDIDIKHLQSNPFANLGVVTRSDINVNQDAYWYSSQASLIPTREWWIGGTSAESDPNGDGVGCISGFMGSGSDSTVPDTMAVEKLVNGNTWELVREFPEANACCGETLKKPFNCMATAQAANFNFDFTRPIVKSGYRMVLFDTLEEGHRPGLNKLVLSSEPCGQPAKSVLTVGEFRAVSSGIHCTDDKVASDASLAFTDTNVKGDVDEALDGGWWRPDNKYDVTTGNVDGSMESVWIGGITHAAEDTSKTVQCITFTQKKVLNKYKFAAQIRLDKLTDGKIWTPVALGTVKATTADTNPDTSANKEVQLTAIVPGGASVTNKCGPLTNYVACDGGTQEAGGKAMFCGETGFCGENTSGAAQSYGGAYDVTI